MRRDRTVLAGIALAALALGGCGGGGAAATTGAPVAGATDTTAQPVGSTNATAATDPAANQAGVGGAAAVSGNTAAAAPIPDTKADDVPALATIAGTADVFAPRAAIDTGQETSTPTPTTPTNTGSTGSTDTSSSSTPTTSTPKVTIAYGPASITLDGQAYSVTTNSVFPKDTGQFKVLSMTASTVTLQLTAGEFTSGAEGITLHTGKTISILNQSEGVSYVLTLESVKATKSSDAAAPGTGN